MVDDALKTLDLTLSKHDMMEFARACFRVNGSGKAKVFTLKGIQSTHGATHRIKERKVYNNIFLDVQLIRVL